MNVKLQKLSKQLTAVQNMLQQQQQQSGQPQQDGVSSPQANGDKDSKDNKSDDETTEAERDIRFGSS